jgi:integrase
MHARWEWIGATLDRPTIRIQASGTWRPKKNRVRVVPLSRKAQEYLDQAREKWGSAGTIFYKDVPTSLSNARTETTAACVKAGILKVDFHGLRRSCGARWLDLGIPVHEVARLLGHSDVATTIKSYGGIADETLVRKMDLVDLSRPIQQPSNSRSSQENSLDIW